MWETNLEGVQFTPSNKDVVSHHSLKPPPSNLSTHLIPICQLTSFQSVFSTKRYYPLPIMNILPHIAPLSNPSLHSPPHHSGDDVIAKTLHEMDMQEHRNRALPFPLIKDPAVTRERKAKYGDGRYGESVDRYWQKQCSTIFFSAIKLSSRQVRTASDYHVPLSHYPTQETASSMTLPNRAGTGTLSDQPWPGGIE